MREYCGTMWGRVPERLPAPAIGSDTDTVRTFLAANGVPASVVEVRSLQVNDLLAPPYRSAPIESRFIIAQTLVVRTAEVDNIAAATQKIGDLVAAGVVLGGEGQPSPGPVYLFTGLNDIKPAMIAEATKSARAGAEQFAEDSGSRITGIRRASQGLFQILPRDDAPRYVGGQSDRQDRPRRLHHRLRTGGFRSGEFADRLGRQLRRIRCTRIG